MKIAVLTLALLLQAATLTPAFACGCELNCPEGEAYSDEHEMCMPITDKTS